MKIFEKQNTIGEAWFRSPNGKKISGNVALSTFGEKYKNNTDSSLYNNITSNEIKRLDVIKDVIILETDSSFFVDKFEMDGDIPVPLNNYNNSITKKPSYSMDYWFDEQYDEITVFYCGLTGDPSVGNVFDLFIYEFKMDDNFLSEKRKLNFNLEENDSIYILNPFRLCYNINTDTFNLSTTFEIAGNTNLNLISLNVRNYEIETLNFVIPV